MKKRGEVTEIDLIGIIIDIWNNKLKIALITVIFMVLSLAVAKTFVLKSSLKAETEILPITIFEDNLYASFNLLINRTNENKNVKNKESESDILYLDEINGKYLLGLFLEELRTRKILIEAIKKYELIDQKKFNSENEYSEAVEKYALTLNLKKPINVDGRDKRSETRLNWIIEFTINENDKEKWEDALSFVNNKINNNIQNYLIINFNNTLNNLKLLNQYQLEDLNKKIEFAKIDYEFQTRNYLAFLNEQASIARELNIKNNTLEVENFSTPSGLISNIQRETPYYMRGYSMIEKEIELIETRTNKDAFTENLLNLEKQKRVFSENNSFQRIEKLFNTTPIIAGNNFKAGEIVYIDTEYKASFSLIQLILILGIFGIILGMFYVLISNAIQKRR